LCHTHHHPQDIAMDDGSVHRSVFRTIQTLPAFPAGLYRPSDNKKVIGIIYLNNNFDYVKMMAITLRQNAFSQDKQR